MPTRSEPYPIPSITLADGALVHLLASGIEPEQRQAWLNDRGLAERSVHHHQGDFTLPMLPHGGDFQALQAAAREHGMVALGCRSTGSIKLDCLPAAETAIAPGDEVIVLR